MRIRRMFLFLSAVVNIPVETLIISPWLLFPKMIISQLELGPPVGCNNSETHHNSSNLNNFRIRIHTKGVVQNKNKRLHCIKVGNGPLGTDHYFSGGEYEKFSSANIFLWTYMSSQTFFSNIIFMQTIFSYEPTRVDH